VVRVDTADVGTGRPMDTGTVADLLRRRAAQSDPATAQVLTAVADGLTAGGTTAIRVDMTPRAADSVRNIILAMEQAQIDARKSSADLAHVRRAWENSTGFRDRPQVGAYPR
jgi:hypothetical protein